MTLFIHLTNVFIEDLLCASTRSYGTEQNKAESPTLPELHFSKGRDDKEEKKMTKINNVPHGHKCKAKQSKQGSGT